MVDLATWTLSSQVDSNNFVIPITIMRDGDHHKIIYMHAEKRETKCILDMEMFSTIL